MNEPLVEQFPSFQSSPAVALVGDQIVVTWIGPGLAGCDVLPFKIYARRYAWNPFGDPTPIGQPFIVNSDPNWPPVNEAAAHPTVAIRNAPGVGPNHFAILWNVKDPTNTYREIHAQYFSDQGSPIGGEVRVNQANVETTVDPGDVPGLANSAQHTAAFTPDCALVSVWTTFPAAEPGESKVYFTILPADYGLNAAPGLFCAKADLTRDGLADGRDVQPFVDLLVAAGAACRSVVDNCPADANCDNSVTVADILPFIDILLGNPPCAPSTQGLLCNPPPEGEGGAVQSAVIDGGQNDDAATDPPVPPTATEEPAEDVEDPALAARWSTFVEWFSEHQPENHPDMTEAEWDAWVTEVMMNTLYVDTAP